ncbi:hypothetical protein ABZW96_35930 [Nocardia sp. NPDC004168]|uniref:hypothetical protein n=1 Tax=Nocardia sp. NPDC004168 TaxID=3154452 RepID=UPI0033AB4842
MPYRSTITGRYISKAAAVRHPNTSVSTSPAGNRAIHTTHRSAITGQYVTPEAAARNPKTTLTENR